MVMLDERQRVSEFTELSEGSKARYGFDWQREYAPAYRECPSAFWLAPDAVDSLPEPDLLHPRPIAQAPQPMIDPLRERVNNRALGAVFAIVLAGPIFVAAASLVDGIFTAGPPIGLSALVLAPITIPFGMVLSALPICIGSLVLGKLGEIGRGWRHPLVWMGVGAPFGMALAALFGAGAQGAATMAITGALCAGIARWKVRWGERVQPVRSAFTPAVAISACPPK